MIAASAHGVSGHGIGLRAAHAARLLAEGAPCAWVEAITENVLGRGGRPRAVLERMRVNSSLCLHGVGLSIGSVDPLNEEYLRALAELTRELEPAVVSDHLCFSSVGAVHGHDLWPLPYTEESLEHVAQRVSTVMDRLGRRIALENISHYVSWRHSDLSEAEFCVELSRRTGCGFLVDVNNLVVSEQNVGFVAAEFLDRVPPSAVMQYHLAGYLDRGEYLLDVHEGPMPATTRDLFKRALLRWGPRPTIFEWDGDVPPLEVVVAQSEAAEAFEHTVLAEVAA